MLTGALQTLFAAAANVPELRAGESFPGPQNELTDTEDKIQAARRFYNGNFRDLNTSIQMFPPNLIANTFGFKEREFFEAEEEAKESVKVDFDNKKEVEGSKKEEESKAGDKDAE